MGGGVPSGIKVAIGGRGPGPGSGDLSLLDVHSGRVEAVRVAVDSEDDSEDDSENDLENDFDDPGCYCEEDEGGNDADNTDTLAA